MSCLPTLGVHSEFVPVQVESARYFPRCVCGIGLQGTHCCLLVGQVPCLLRPCFPFLKVCFPLKEDLPLHTSRRKVLYNFSLFCDCKRRWAALWLRTDNSKFEFWLFSFRTQSGVLFEFLLSCGNRYGVLLQSLAQTRIASTLKVSDHGAIFV